MVVVKLVAMHGAAATTEAVYRPPCSGSERSEASIAHGGLLAAGFQGGNGHVLYRGGEHRVNN